MKFAYVVTLMNYISEDVSFILDYPFTLFLISFSVRALLHCVNVMPDIFRFT
jgi:hypothetical protein